jgi:hypothetical protein
VEEKRGERPTCFRTRETAVATPKTDFTLGETCALILWRFDQSLIHRLIRSVQSINRSCLPTAGTTTVLIAAAAEEAKREQNGQVQKEKGTDHGIDDDDDDDGVLQ